MFIKVVAWLIFDFQNFDSATPLPLIRPNEKAQKKNS